jgi:hypothetical protein
MKHKSIDDEIDNVLKFMKEYKADSDEYSKAVHNLKELCEARSKKDPQLINILIIVVPAITALIQVIVILNHEELHVITTKAIGFVVKGRL